MRQRSKDLFFEKKKLECLVQPRIKSFLVLFFKKELLSYFTSPDNTNQNPNPLEVFRGVKAECSLPACGMA